jgi:hypothetical protein
MCSLHRELVFSRPIAQANFLVETAQRGGAYQLIASLSARFSTPLKSDGMISPGNIPGC